MKSGELRRNSNEGTEENAPRNEAQIVNGRSKVGRALTTSSISSFWHSFARLDRSVDKILQFMPNSSTLLGPFVLQSMISQSISPSFRNMRTFRCIYCLLSSPLLCVGGGNKKAYLHTHDSRSMKDWLWFRGNETCLWIAAVVKNMSVLKVLRDISTLGIAEYSVHEEFVHVVLNTIALVWYICSHISRVVRSGTLRRRGHQGLVPKSE